MSISDAYIMITCDKCGQGEHYEWNRLTNIE